MTTKQLPFSFKPVISRQCWGHGEYGYVLTIFSSHDENKVKQALNWLLTQMDNKK